MHEQAQRERHDLTEELLRLGRKLAELPDDGAFDQKIDLRERQKELRLRLATLDDLIELDEDNEWEEGNEAHDARREPDVIDLVEQESRPGILTRMFRA